MATIMTGSNTALFQSREDLIMLDELARDAGLPSLYNPTDPVILRDILDNGSLKHFLSRTRNTNPRVSHHDYCILAAAAMAVGARLEPDDMAHLHRVCNHSYLLEDGTAQMKEALDGYKNDGTPWNFETNEADEEGEDDGKSGTSQSSETYCHSIGSEGVGEGVEDEAKEENSQKISTEGQPAKVFELGVLEEQLLDPESLARFHAHMAFYDHLENPDFADSVNIDGEGEGRLDFGAGPGIGDDQFHDWYRTEGGFAGPHSGA